MEDKWKTDVEQTENKRGRIEEKKHGMNEWKMNET